MHTYVAHWPRREPVSWRLLTWEEHKRFSRLSQLHSPMSVYLDVYRTCRLTGPDPDEVTAGIVEFIGSFCLEGSIFSQDYEVTATKLQKARAKVSGNYLYTLKAVVASVFKYPFEDIDKWDDQTLLARVVAAEGILGRTFDPVKELTEEEKAKLKEDRRKNPPRPRKELTPAQQEVIARRNANR